MNPEVVASQASASTGRVAPFGKYLLLQRVSVGGMAEVYKAIPEGASRVDQIVAIKRILPNIAEDREFIGMFIDEARIAGQLDHPNICRIYELGRVAGDHYIAMQFLWGRDLLKVMNRYKKASQQLPPAMAALIAARACAALHYAHQKCDENGQPLHIIHRDVSPQNIIVGYAGQIKLIDFGVARAASQSQKTQAGILKGKFGYMSPEMIRGLSVDHRSDVFAMGICLHEALTGARLFYGETDFATLELVRDARIKPPSATSPLVPPELDAIVLRALARDADQRYESAGAMDEALQRFLATHEPGYSETDVAAQMRLAFAPEVSREKHRIDTYTRMLSAGALVRGASIPALHIDPPPSGERNAANVPPAATHEPIPSAQTKPSPLSEDELRRLSGEHDLHEEQTQIFFSTAELDQLRLLSQGPALSSPELGSGLPPPMPSSASSGADRQSWPSPLAASEWAAARTTPTPEATRWRDVPGTVPPGVDTHAESHFPVFGAPDAFSRGAPSSSPGLPAPALGSGPLGIPDHASPSFRNLEATEESASQRYISTESLKPAWRPNRSTQRAGTMRTLVLVSAALALGGLGYFVTRSTANNTATLTIEDVGDPDALVRVDGIVRGNPPLTVEGLKPGVHMLELQAAGSDVARAEVAMDPGETRSVRLVLTPQAVPPTMQLQTAPTPPNPTGANVPTLPAIELEPAAGARGRIRRATASENTDAPPVGAPVGATDAITAALLEGGPAAPASSTHPSPASPAATPPDSTEGAADLAPQINTETAALNQGELLISTVPWSHVFVDGTDTGRDTPIRALRVPAGQHTLGLRTPDGETHEIPFSVEPGRVVRIVRRF